jgi:hypothetical protein
VTAIDWLDAVRGVLHAQVDAARERWLAAEPVPGVHGAVDQILAGASPMPVTVAAAVRRADAVLAASPRWLRLAEVYAVERTGLQWLALLAALEADPRLARVLGYLSDSAYLAPPTPAVAGEIWGWAPGERPAPGSAMATAGVATATGWQATDTWVIAPDVAAYLCDSPDWPLRWSPGQALSADGLDCLFPELITQMQEATAAVLTHGTPCEVELVGAAGSGRRTLLAQLAGRLGRTPYLVTGAGAADRMCAVRTTRLLGAAPVITDDGPVPGAELILAGRTAPAGSAGSGVRLSWPMPHLGGAMRDALWRSASARPTPPVVRDWDLTPADVLIAAAAAGAGDDVTGEVVARRLRSVSITSMTAMNCPYGWDDLVLPPQLRAVIDGIRQRVSFRREVLDCWEFARLCPDSPGLTALFAGPSGTGKTMAAQVLARSLGLDLYRVDLAEVVNKYIGETEKRLADVFAECERSNLMVLFDEADALFGQRTRVRDSHDRFANIEIDYLLQRMDSFSGLAVLATNRKSDLDPAFLRRIQVIADFPAPVPADRLRLWRLALPASTTAGEPITAALDIDWLASALELTGAEIKAIALAAAFTARARDELITTSHVLDAARREMGKRGAVMRAELPGPAERAGLAVAR